MAEDKTCSLTFLRGLWVSGVLQSEGQFLVSFPSFLPHPVTFSFFISFIFGISVRRPGILSPWIYRLSMRNLEGSGCVNGGGREVPSLSWLKVKE